MTKKQTRWQKRSRVLWRLKGITGFDLTPGVVTPFEKELLTRALGLIKHVVEHSTLSSRQLGFNAKRRCAWCGCNRVASNESNYCREHSRMAALEPEDDWEELL